jgi:hypothetical protein
MDPHWLNLAFFHRSARPKRHGPVGGILNDIHHNPAENAAHGQESNKAAGDPSLLFKGIGAAADPIH